MAHRHDKYIFPGSIEHEYKYMGRYGAKGEKREVKHQATKEQIAKQNQWNREKWMRRLIKANFSEDDYWITLKYPKGTRKPVGEVRKDFKKFLDRMRRRYKCRGMPLKFIYRMEVGKRGGIHIHILINRLEGETDVLVKECWTFGKMHYELLYDAGGYQGLGNYIVKLPDEEVEKQLCLFSDEEKKELIRYSCSRNLKRVEPKTKIYKHWTMRRILENGPKPTPGYYIDKESVKCGINSVTGMSYLYYTEYPLKKPERGKPPNG